MLLSNVWLRCETDVVAYNLFDYIHGDRNLGEIIRRAAWTEHSTEQQSTAQHSTQYNRNMERRQVRINSTNEAFERTSSSRLQKVFATSLNSHSHTLWGKCGRLVRKWNPQIGVIWMIVVWLLRWSNRIAPIEDMRNLQFDTISHSVHFCIYLGFCAEP